MRTCSESEKSSASHDAFRLAVNVAVVALLFLSDTRVARTAENLPAEEALLTWPGGDSLSGRLLSASDSELRWQSPLFAEPLEFQLNSVAGIRFQSEAHAIDQSKPPDSAEMRIGLDNGDVILGALIGLTDNEMEFRTARHGRIRLTRKRVRSLRHPEDYGTIYSGPDGLRDWRHPVISSWPSPPGWQEESDGSLSTTRRDAVMFLPLEFPEQAEIEIALSSGSHPGFELAFGSQSDGAVAVISGDSRVRVVSGKQEWELMRLHDQDRRMNLVFQIDFSKGLLSVYSETGRRLLRLENLKMTQGRPGLLLRNGKDDLTLHRLNVASGNRDDSDDLRPGDSRVFTADGKVHFGLLSEVDETADRLTIRTRDSDVSVKLSDVRGIFPDVSDSAKSVSQQPPGEPDPAASGPVKAFWADGTVVSGQLIEITDSVTVIRADFTETPVRSQTKGLIRLSNAAAVPVSDAHDRLYLGDQSSLPGTLQPSGMNLQNRDSDGTDNHSERLHPDQQRSSSQESVIRWRVPGAESFSPLIRSPFRVVRNSHRSSSDEASPEHPDVVYLTSEDIVPCRIEQVSDDQLRVSSAWFSETQIPTTMIRAVELHRPEKVGRRGFVESEWMRIVGRADLQPETLTFRASEAIGHKDLLDGNVLRFRLSWSEQITASLTLNLYTDLPSIYPEGTFIAFDCRDRTISVRDGSAEPPARGNTVGNAPTPGVITLRDRTAEVTVLRQADQVRVSIDGRAAQSFDLRMKSAESRGLLLRGSVVNRGSGSSRTSAKSSGSVKAPDDGLQISDFEVLRLAGGSIRQFIDQKAREMTLSLPVTQQQSPPEHVVLAPNGDLLRGKLTDISGDQITFISRNEPIRLERNQIAAMIWLHPNSLHPNSEVTPDENNTFDTASGAVSSPHRSASSHHEMNHQVRVITPEGFRITMTPGQSDRDELRGTSSILGQFRIRLEEIQELNSFDWPDTESDQSFRDWRLTRMKAPEWDVPVDETRKAESLRLIGQQLDLPALKLLDGTTVSLSEKKAVIILHFWTTWFGPCRESLRETLSLASEFAPEQVVMISVNAGESPPAVREFLREQKLQINPTIDSDGILYQQFRVPTIPCTVVLSPEQRVLAVSSGASHNADDHEARLHEIRTIIRKAMKPESP